MKATRNITIIFMCVALVVMIMPTPAKADQSELQVAEDIASQVIELYGTANNTDLFYTVQNSESVYTIIDSLYTEYSAQASDPYSLAALGAAFAAAATIAVIYDAATGKGFVQYVVDTDIDQLDDFWNYVFTGVDEIVKVDNEYYWSTNQQNIVESVPIYEAPDFYLNGYHVYEPPYYNIANNHNFYYDGFTFFFLVKNSNSNSGYVYFMTLSSNGTYTQHYLNNGEPATANMSMTNRTYWNGNSNADYSFDRLGTNINLTDYNYTFIRDSSNDQYPMDYFNPSSSGNTNQIEDLGNYANLEPTKSSVDNDYTVITIPDNTAQDYVASDKVTIQTNIEWNDDWGDFTAETPVDGEVYEITDNEILNEMIPDIQELISQNDVEITDYWVGDVEPDPDPDPDPEPSPSPSPDPVPDPDPDPDNDPSEQPTYDTYHSIEPFTLPNFNFNFSGIWHYVREWWASLSSWTVMLFEVWSNLPYAISVPVYATAVIVIVLGVYKRFF